MSSDNSAANLLPAARAGTSNPAGGKRESTGIRLETQQGIERFPIFYP